MGLIADCGYDPAYVHEGHLITVLDDGTEPGCLWSAEIAGRISGWHIGCSCGWRDHEFWDRDPDDEVGHPPDELDGDDGALLHRWRDHLDDTLPEIRVAEAAVLASGERDRLDSAVRRARSVGASWSAVASAAGMSKQAAHERWAAVVNGSALDVVDDRPMGMKKMAYLRLRDLLRHRDHLAQQRWGRALQDFQVFRGDQVDTAEYRAAELEIARAEAESQTWKAAEGLLTDFYGSDSRR